MRARTLYVEGRHSLRAHIVIYVTRAIGAMPPIMGNYRKPEVKVASRVLLYVVASGGKNAVRFHIDVLFEPDKES